jgi:hypothetical protein
MNSIISHACILLFRTRFIIDIQSFVIYGIQVDQRQRSILVKGKKSSSSLSSQSQMHSELEMSPIDKRSDYRFHCSIQPLYAVYDAVRNRIR